jgi:SAM-dependent methyltransferase
MNWKVKAALQHAVSLLPSQASHEVYYRLQRRWGTLRDVNPVEGFENGLRLVHAIEAAGGSMPGKVVLEVGTGRRVNVPIVFWLCGAARVLTVDLNQYLKPGLILEDLKFVRGHPVTVKQMFGARAESGEFQQRFALLMRDDLSVPELLAAAEIEYVAPLDARKLHLGDDVVDYHVSNNVLEHVPPDELRDILVEGKRVLKSDGLLVHRVDFSDHFSEVDARVSTINFLKYSERQWRRYAGNLYNYHNRLRIDELESIVGVTGLVIADQQAEIDAAALRLLESGFAVDPRFAGKPTQVNATQSVVTVLARGVSAAESTLSGGFRGASSDRVSGYA